MGLGDTPFLSTRRFGNRRRHAATVAEQLFASFRLYGSLTEVT
jgi:hypothetical protein